MDAIFAADILSDGSGYGSVFVEFKNGASLGGNLIAESPDHLDLDATGKLVRVSHSDIASFTPPISSMPPMGTLLNAAELRDIVAWLASLTEGGVPVKSTAVPVPLDPATLEIPEKSVTPAAGGIDPTLIKTGKQQFLVCGACHGQRGKGTAAGPPLTSSEWVTDPEEACSASSSAACKAPSRSRASNALPCWHGSHGPRIGRGNRRRAHLRSQFIWKLRTASDYSHAQQPVSLRERRLWKKRLPL